MSVNNTNPWSTALSQTTAVFSGLEQQQFVKEHRPNSEAEESFRKCLTQWYITLSQTPQRQQQLIKVHETTDQWIAEGSRKNYEMQDQTVSKKVSWDCYGKTTWIKVNINARKALNSIGRIKIKNWTGNDLNEILSGKQEIITLRNARIINLNAENPVFETINADCIDKFTVDQTTREKLEQLSGKCGFASICMRFDFNEKELGDCKNNNQTSILKEHAEKYNEYFKSKFPGLNSDVFDLNRILKEAKDESIKKRELSTEALIGINSNIKSKLNDLYQDPHKDIILIKALQDISKIKGTKFIHYLINQAASITIKDAVLINKILKKNSQNSIFDLQEEDIVTFSLHRDHLDKLDTLMNREKEQGKRIDRVIKKIISDLKKVGPPGVKPEVAKQLESHFKTKIFDFTMILLHAEEEAEEDIQILSALPQKHQEATKTPKRKRNSGSSKEPSEPTSKKRRTKKENLALQMTNSSSPVSPMSSQLNAPNSQLNTSNDEVSPGGYFQAPSSFPPEYDPFADDVLSDSSY